MNKSEYDKQYYQKNREAKLAHSKNYYHTIGKNKRNSSEFREHQRNYKRKRFNSDPIFKLKCNLRRSISHAFSGKRKSKKSVILLGCSFEMAKTYLASLFQPGMNWDNYGKWHVDHIIPLSTANSVEELEKLWYYTNLQPLWAKDNLHKSDKLNWKNNL